MIFLLIFLFIIVITRTKLSVKGFFGDCISKDKSTCIKGIFVILVFFRHYITYANLSESIINKPMLILDSILGQCIVAMFFFYSGYGIYEQIKYNKETYLREFPIKRILITFLQFAIAIFSFLLLDIISGRIDQYSLKTVFLSFIGWESIGNSNWYMFVTFLLYIFVFISFLMFKKNDKIAIFFVIFLSIIYGMTILNFKPQWWMDTILCFPLGMLFSYYKQKIFEICKNNKFYYSFAFILIILYTILNYIYKKNNVTALYCIITSIFPIIVVLITMKVSINNKVLHFLGKNVFWIYILQRIPLIIFQDLIENQYIYFVVTFIVTIFLSNTYYYFFDKKIILYIKNKTLKLS